ERLVRRVAGPGRAEGEHLPPRLPHGGEGFDPSVGDRPEVADPERAGQAGRVEEDAGGPRQGRGTHREWAREEDGRYIRSSRPGGRCQCRRPTATKSRDCW